MDTFCTIINSDYAPYSLALYKSLCKFNPDAVLQVLVIDDDKSACNRISNSPGIRLYFAKDLFNYGLVHTLYKKYAHINNDSYRWALKPVFISYLLEHGFDKVLYTDCDIFFFNDYTFLLQELNTSNILLTPHWRNSDPLTDEESFFALFTGGIFNAGFIASNKKGLPALHWWADACHYKMGPFLELGIYDDQRYLDVLPVKFESVKIIRHKGCNISGWNRTECQRNQVGDKILINNVFPIIFIHFNPVLIQEIIKGHDPNLLPYLKEYRTVFEEEGTPLTTLKKQLHYYLNANAIMRLKWKLKIKTKVKSILFKIAKSI